MARASIEGGEVAASSRSLARDAALETRRTAYNSHGRHLAADEAALGAPRITAEGYLEAPARLTRTGIFEYLELPDGSEPKSITDGQARVVRMLRLPSEVFRADSLASLDRKPLTRGHPIDATLSASSWRTHAVGIVDQVRKADDGQHVEGRVLIQDAATVEAVKSGERQISCGYFYRREPVEGGRWTDVNGEIGPAGSTHAVDVIQRDIAGNHHAIVQRGRAGPTAAILLDEADPRNDTMDPEQLKKMMAEMIGDALRAHDKSKADAAKADEDAKKAEADAKAKDAPKKDADPEDPKKPDPELEAVKKENDALKTAVDSLLADRQRAEVAALVKAHGTEIAKDAASIAALARMDATTIRRKVLESRGAVLPEKASAEAIAIAFDAALSLAPVGPPSSSVLAGLIAAGAHSVAQDATDVAAARAAYVKASTDAWKTADK